MVTVEQLRTIWSAESGSSKVFPSLRSPLSRFRVPALGVATPRALRCVRTASYILVTFILIWAAVPQAIRLAVHARCYDSITDIPAQPVAVVFGAGITERGKLTPVLRDRVNAAVALYQAHKVQKLLMTGDDAHVYHNEPWAMRKYAIRCGVPARDIACDYAGFRTYDSCYRARKIFGVGRAILVTQAFHLPRAIFVARTLGIDACGYAAANPLRRSSCARMFFRENSCLLAGLCDLAIHRQPKFLGKPEPL